MFVHVHVRFPPISEVTLLQAFEVRSAYSIFFSSFCNNVFDYFKDISKTVKNKNTNTV